MFEVGYKFSPQLNEPPDVRDNIITKRKVCSNWVKPLSTCHHQTEDCKAYSVLLDHCLCNLLPNILMLKYNITECYLLAGVEKTNNSVSLSNCCWGV